MKLYKAYISTIIFAVTLISLPSLLFSQSLTNPASAFKGEFDPSAYRENKLLSSLLEKEGFKLGITPEEAKKSMALIKKHILLPLGPT